MDNTRNATSSRSLRQTQNRAIFGLVLALVSSAGLFGCAPSTTERLGLAPLQTVASVNLDQYTGVWYEIASFPQSFQEGCTNTTATYQKRDDGEINVTNRCNKFAPDGPEDKAEGRARVVDPTSNAKLQVSFFRPFWGDYWIIDLAPDYSYAVVGHPGRDYLWILSRSPQMDESTYSQILGRLTEKGYETSRLVKTVQSPNKTAQTKENTSG